MTTPRLLTASLRTAIQTLEEVLAQPPSVFMRDATIQRFEYTYELAQKLMRRYLEQKFSSEEIDTLTRKEILRTARENGLIQDVEAWFAYHETRNETSHAYDEQLAERVAAVAAKFVPDVKRFLQELERRI